MLLQENALHIFTDGSSMGKPRAGGIGVRFVLVDSSGEEQIQDFDFDGYPNATNNMMELHACITALKEAAKQNLSTNISKIFIYTDSQYVADNYKRAMFQWSKTRWFLSSGKPVLNAEQWKELNRCIQKAGRHVEIKWIKGHAKNIHNKAVDKLAKKSAKLPYQKPLKHINLRRKKTKKSVEIGSIGIEGQRITIHIITSEYLTVQQLWKYKYEVMSKSSKYYQNVDLIFSSPENFMSTGHIYFVKFNSDKQNPRVEKVFYDLKEKRKTPMPTTIQITAGTVKLKAELNDCPTSKAILKALPIRANGNRWEGEIYFTIPIKAQLEKDNSRDILEVGELGYWPTGSAFCIFFGKTPASKGTEIRAASAVNILGKVIGDVSALWDVEDGAEVRIEKV